MHSTATTEPKKLEMSLTLIKPLASSFKRRTVTLIWPSLICDLNIHVPQEPIYINDERGCGISSSLSYFTTANIAVCRGSLGDHQLAETTGSDGHRPFKQFANMKSDDISEYLMHLQELAGSRSRRARAIEQGQAGSNGKQAAAKGKQPETSSQSQSARG